jgi:hypothetical protein
VGRSSRPLCRRLNSIRQHTSADVSIEVRRLSTSTRGRASCLLRRRLNKMLTTKAPLLSPPRLL